MRKLVSKYGTAAHLALLTVAPLSLFPYFAPDAIATVVLWLAGLSVVWVLMNPSRRIDETAHESRRRVLFDCLRDPLFWFSIFFAVLACVRWMNAGVELAYDAQNGKWLVSAPPSPMLPSCVTGGGFLAFAVATALVVIFAGIRHALGRKARMAFLLVSAIASGMAAILALCSVSLGDAGLRTLARCSAATPECMGTAFGLFALGGLVAHFGCVEFRWIRAELLATVALAANAIGLLAFSPLATTLVFAVAFLLMAVLFLVLTRNVLVGMGQFRCALAILTVLVLAGVFAVFAPGEFAMGDRLRAVLALEPFPEGFIRPLRSTLSDIAFRAWKDSPWTGTGLGSFPVDLHFFATAAEWKDVLPRQSAVPNGWWMLLVERGVLGGLTFLIAFGLLAWSFFSRLVRSFGVMRASPLLFLGPVSLLAVVALTFVDCSLLRPDALLAICGFLALSASDIPERRKKGHEGKITEDGNGQ